MWLKWLPWKFMIRAAARRRGFIDPLALLERFNSISQPSETKAPLELLRAGFVLHARGFINNQVIDHNLDWIWPMWVHRQFDPHHPAFIPRAFALTHVNLTQRNWTAVGYPGCPETPIVDAAGLLMPFFDSWSLDGWFVADTGESVIPSRMGHVVQNLEIEGNMRVTTVATSPEATLRMIAEVVVEQGAPVCKLTLRATSHHAGWLVASLRPYNPEGVSYVNELEWMADSMGWEINRERKVHFSRMPEQTLLSRYRDGDVYFSLQKKDFVPKSSVTCEVGLATGAVLYRVVPGTEAEVTLSIPLLLPKAGVAPESLTAEEKWHAAFTGGVPFTGGTGRFGFLFAAAERTALLLSPREINAGTYTYKRFWFRDAAIILHALMCLGHRRVAERSLDFFIAQQASNGYFRSQDGEWDSNGQVLWALGRYCRLFHLPPKPGWVEAIRKAVHWIRHKRGGPVPGKIYSELMPAGFSAEHLGPNDFYYWDDFWTLSGLHFAEEMLRQSGEGATADEAAAEADALSRAIDQSLRSVANRIRSAAMPASPHRRLDSAAIGSVAVGFPLQLWPGHDSRLLATLDYLHENCLVHGALFHVVTHSGINPYLSLHLAQCLLRAGDVRFRNIMEAIADLASDTGQWPEAIHPQLRTGCMGDGQHGWAAAEWLMMVRNCFLFEEEFENKLIVAAGISTAWCQTNKAHFGPAPTRFGTVSVTLEIRGEEIDLVWNAEWFGSEPEIDVRFAEAGLELIAKEPGLYRYRKSET
jgi:hypothetical protein